MDMDFKPNPNIGLSRTSIENDYVVQYFLKNDGCRMRSNES